MDRLFRVKMPIKTYLKKFITFSEGDSPVINNKTPFGRYVFAMLSKETIRDANYAPTWLATDRMTDTLTLQVTMRTFTHVGHTVTAEKAVYINKFIRDEFGRAMCLAAMNLHFRKGMSIKQALVHFAETHDIELDVDITMDNLAKIYHRTMVSMEPKSHQNISSPLLLPYDLGEQMILFDLPIQPESLEKNVTKNFRKNPPPEPEGMDTSQLSFFE